MKEESLKKYEELKNYLRKINRHSPYLSITLPKYYQYYL